MRVSAALLLVGVVGCGFKANPESGVDAAPPNPTVGFASAASSADEKMPSVMVQVELSMAHDQPVTVAYSATGGTALPTTDYVLAAGTLAFAPGETTKQIEVQIVADGEMEVDETIELALASPTEATLGAAAHTITIANDFLPRVSFTKSSVESPEGDSVLVELVLDKASDVDTSIDVIVADGGTASDADYDFQTTTVTFPAGMTTGSLSFKGSPDNLDEEDLENVPLQLQNPSVGLQTGTLFTEDINLKDDDAMPTVSFKVATSNAQEGGGPYGFIVALSAVSGRDVSIPFVIDTTVANAATATTDYVILTSNPHVIPAGELEVSIRMGVVDDTAIESNEIVDLTLQTPTNATLGAIPHRVVTIESNDTPSLQFTASNSFHNEADQDIDLTVTLTPAAPNVVTVQFGQQQTQGNDLSNSEYDFETASPLTFQPGETSKTIRLDLIDDNQQEGTEFLRIILFNASGARIGNPGAHTISVSD